VQVQEFLFRLAAALLMGGAVGLERQRRSGAAELRTTALISAGASAFVMCAFLVGDASRGQVQIVSYVVSGVGFLGAGVIFKNSGRTHGLNTAATIWCSAAVGAISGLGSTGHALILTATVLCTNIIFRPLADRLFPVPAADDDQEVGYGLEVICRPEDEVHIRARLLQAMSTTVLSPFALQSEDIAGTAKMKVTARIRGRGRQDLILEQLVATVSLEAGVSSVSWALCADGFQ
jgi:putative Mg2+ transporter-C (MgtC) family protein